MYLPPGPTTPRPPVPATDDAGAPPVLTWTGAGGQVIRLTDDEAGYLLLPGVRGLELPGYLHHERESGALDGSIITGTRALPREIYLPVYVHGRNRSEAVARRRALALAMHPASPEGGPGVLEVADRSGTRRSIQARYVEGMAGDEGTDLAGAYWATYGVLLTAEQPYWELAPVRRTWRIDGTHHTWLPLPPLRVRGSQVIGDGMSITNPGSARAWPVWTITGPVASGTVMRSRTLGQELELDLALADGQSVTIDTRPRRKSVRDQHGRNQFGRLKRGSRLWPLAPGPNTVDVVLGGADAGASLELEFVPLDLTTMEADV
ncbi:phage tail family protein [Nocardiopsis exhalans]|uniref:Phage tail family protein n=1 Tax=Nocardiopsis exhalans TaxID=163604 RepID=A0ABY5DIE6_9ACTN|nr:phage tail domain-containing protein [Nocardiopsis exhalans]USY23215.1 phage tail family protein [Nocardiopsis exhalans]